jgi:DNA polymerase-3 subunit delta
MRLQFHQLADSLGRAPAPVYLICGDEPLQLGEAARIVREAARRNGFEEREILEVDGSFDWGLLMAAAQSMSLFSSRKLIELRLSSGKIGRDGSHAVQEYCAKPAEDNLLLIVAPALEHKELKSKWVQTVERSGVLLQVRTVHGRQLEEWIARRLRERGIAPGSGVTAMLAERVEGNLLAAAQEIEKLILLYGEGPLAADQLIRAISDSSRFDLFDIPNAALAGDRARVNRVIKGLAAEGTPEPLVLWVLARELRLLARAAFAARRSAIELEALFTSERVGQSRRGHIRDALRRLSPSLLQALLARCAEVDRQIKGLEPGDPWLSLADIGDTLAGGGSAV